MTARARRGRALGLACLAVLPLLAGCASVIPDSGGRVSSGPPPIAAKPAPAPTGNPRPYQPRPSTPSGSAAKPIPATPNPPLPAAPVPAGATTAAASGVVAGPAFDTLGVSAEQARAALAAFRLSCSSVQRRTDTSGLTQGADWTEPATRRKAGPTATRAISSRAISRRCRSVTATTFVTGYYEPEIAGSRDRRAGYDSAHLSPPRRPDRRRSRPILRRSEGQEDPRPRRWHATSCPITTAPRSRAARSTGAGSKSLMRPMPSNSSSCRSRARAGCACPTAA